VGEREKRREEKRREEEEEGKKERKKVRRQRRTMSRVDCFAELSTTRRTDPGGSRRMIDIHSTPR